MTASACQELWRSSQDRQKREPRLDEIEFAEKHQELLDAGSAVPIAQSSLYKVHSCHDCIDRQRLGQAFAYRISSIPTRGEPHLP